MNEIRLSGEERITVVWRNHKPIEIVEVEEVHMDGVDEDEYSHYQWRAARVEDFK